MLEGVVEGGGSRVEMGGSVADEGSWELMEEGEGR